MLVNKNWALYVEDIPKITRGFGLEFHSWNQSNFSDRNSVFVACQKEAVLLHIFQLEIWSSPKIFHFQNFTAGSLLNDFRGYSILLLDGKAESNWCKIPNWCFVGRRTDLNLHIYPSKFHLISQSQSPLGMKKVVLLCIPLRQHDMDRQNKTNSYLSSILYGGIFVLFFTLFCFRNRWYRYWFFALMRLLIIVLRIKLIKAVALVAAEYLFSKNIFGSCGSSCDVPQSGHYGNFLSKYFHFWNTPEILLQSLKNCKDDRTISLQFKGWRFFGQGEIQRSQ